MEYRANYPIYLQIIEDLQRRIVIGELNPGDRLPGGAELALSYQVNPNTIGRVYRQLERDGVSYSKRGIGTFLVNDSALPARLQRQIGENLCAKFLSRMRLYHFAKEEIYALLEEEYQKGEKEESAC